MQTIVPDPRRRSDGRAHHAATFHVKRRDIGAGTAVMK